MTWFLGGPLSLNEQAANNLSATYFLTLCEIATLVWVAAHTMGLIAYFTSRCKVRCTDQSRGTRWDGQKNEVTTFSRDAKINTAAMFNIQWWIADSFINWRCKTKKKVVVSLHNFLCILQWCSRDRNLRDRERDLAQISWRDQDRDFVIKAETETETWKFETETETRDLTFLWW